MGDGGVLQKEESEREEPNVRFLEKGGRATVSGRISDQSEKKGGTHVDADLTSKGTEDQEWMGGGGVFDLEKGLARRNGRKRQRSRLRKPPFGYREERGNKPRVERNGAFGKGGCFS